MNDIFDLRTSCEEAAARCERWMLAYLKPTDVASETFSDPLVFYKWPLTLVVRKQKRQARKLFRTIIGRCLLPNGDLDSDRSGFHSAFHSYANCWMALAAVVLEEEAIEPLSTFLFNAQNSRTGGVFTDPGSDGELTEDPLSTAFVGWLACQLEERDVADAAVGYMTACCERQGGDGFFWLRSTSDGKSVLSIPEGEDEKTYVLDLGAPEQAYYFLGAVCVFLARHAEVFGHTDEVSRLTARMLAILGNIEPYALRTIWAAKVAPGAVDLFSATKNERFLTIARPVIEEVLTLQSDDGYWLKDGKPWVTVSAEQCYWLTGIAQRL